MCYNENKSRMKYLAQGASESNPVSCAVSFYVESLLHVINEPNIKFIFMKIWNIFTMHKSFIINNWILKNRKLFFFIYFLILSFAFSILWLLWKLYKHYEFLIYVVLLDLLSFSTAGKINAQVFKLKNKIWNLSCKKNSYHKNPSKEEKKIQ